MTINRTVGILLITAAVMMIALIFSLEVDAEKKRIKVKELTAEVDRINKLWTLSLKETSDIIDEYNKCSNQIIETRDAYAGSIKEITGYLKRKAEWLDTIHKELLRNEGGN